MKNQFLLLIALAFTISTANSQDKKICVTIDDLPVVTYGINNIKFQQELTENLIRTFDKFEIPAIGYVNESKLYKDGHLDSARVNLLIEWVKNGYELGNHTYSHPDYNDTPDSQYFDDILKGQQIIQPLMDKYGMELRYFRHPFLHAGENSEKFDALNEFLNANQYEVAPVTIDNDDYIFAKAYHNAYVEKDKSLMKKIGKEYVEYMEQKLHFFEQRSNDVFGRNIIHSLLIHASFLNAEYLDELAAMYKKNGYTFVSQEEALRDEAYSTHISFYTEYGLSWIFRWGISMGLANKDLRNGDIEVPGFVMEVFNR